MTCEGSEKFLFDCSFSKSLGQCPSGEGAAIVCQGKLPYLLVDQIIINTQWYILVLCAVAIHHTHSFWLQCVYNLSTDPRSTSEASCTDWDIRLVNGSNPLEGRLEICFNRAWGTVCSTKFSIKDANVTCNQLGFPFNGTELLFDSGIPPGSGPIFLDEVPCDGHETKLELCEGTSPGLYYCTHNEDVVIRCIG